MVDSRENWIILYISYLCLHVDLHENKKAVFSPIKYRKRQDARSCLYLYFLPQTSIPSSNIYHPDVAEPIVQVFLLEDIAQLVAYYFRVTNLSVDVGV